MSQQLKAIYEDGVFRPLEPVRLEEHQEVTLVLENEHTASSEEATKPIWEVAAELAGKIPLDAVEVLPADGAAQHDHYLYAAPKRN